MDLVSRVINGISLFFDGVIYSALSYTFKLFLLLCQLNLNYIYALVSGLVDRLEAVIMVFIVFKLGISLVQYLLNPEDSIMKKGADLVKNVFITAALLISYNFIFGLGNDLSILVIGAPDGYSYPTLSQIIEVSDEADAGLIMRFVFGKDSEIDDIGDYISFETLSMFLREDGDILSTAISEGEGYNFHKVTNIADDIGKTVEYTPIISGIMGMFLIYSIVKSALKIGIRMFKLVVLQLAAPLAIISIIQEGVKGKFANYCKVYFSTLIDAFIRILTMLIITVLISKFFISIGDFFQVSSTATTNGGNTLSDGITSVLLTIIVMVAGYMFMNELPAFINKALGTSLDDKANSGFGSFLGGLAGFTAGGISGLASGIGKKAGGAGIFANAVAGAFGGASAGAKGNGIAEKFKNIKGANDKSAARAADWAYRGGLINTARGGIEQAFGVKRRQDNEMEFYDAQQAALDAYDNAQKDAIKDTKLGATESISWTDLNGVTHTGSASDQYGAGFSEVKFSDKDTFVSKMQAFDKGVMDAQAKLAVAEKGTNVDKIKEARAEYSAAVAEANKKAGDIYDSRKSNASSDEITYRKNAVVSTMKKTNDAPVENANGSIKVKDTGNAITGKKQELARKDSYSRTHGKPTK